MTFYRWAMRNGAPILFACSLLVFMIAFIGPVAFFPRGFGGGHSGVFVIFAALAAALQTSGTMFAAACIVYILGRAYPAADNGARQ